ncbi:SUMO protein smt3 [Tieghemiomyces parasiticus]|uniref:SUMO protein smt3 n=1 Tax=Tieghemiomyces parasiticus TaxID=78921 RepID=A0A9W8DQJ7_9FUNG|nr:SUMO protein smt3 [Tieghemiomyces parasiticus]KAJ1923983.1 SUMO protein smt3 [Tieghemiomyces parasiticus]
MSEPSGSPAQDVKPVKPETTEHINVKVVSADSSEIHFKIKRHTALRKLMETYCERAGKSSNSVRFLYEGERIQATDTPDKLDMQDEDTIDVMVEQLGGAISL